MKFKIYTLLFLLFTLISCSQKDTFQLLSPDKDLGIYVSNLNNRCSFSLIYKGDTLVNPSALGLQVMDTKFTENVSLSDFSEKQFDETWTTINGKQPTVRNHYNEYSIKVETVNNPQKFYTIIFRLYDDGFAYRYSLTTKAASDSLLINKELTNINFNQDFTYWATNGEHHNLGPITRSEKEFENVIPPVVLQFSKKNFIAIHEAEILEFAPFTVNATTIDHSFSFNIDYSKRNTSFKTSWRAFMLGDEAGDLVESDLLVNLNEPCKIEDPSWVKPGKSLWDWRVWGYKAPDGYEYALNTESHKRLIDFASENNIQYLLIDADWYGEEFNENSDPTSAREGINIEECMEYALSKQVGIILYLNDVGAKKFGLERVLKQFSDWGAIGVKYGFMTGSQEDKVKQTRRVVELCAKYKLMVNFHDYPIPPSGDRRTYPNLVTKEFCHAQADAMRSYFPETAVNQVLINMIAGPIDATNGWFDLNNAHSRVRVFEEIPGTVVAEVAKLITNYSGWMVLPDSPEAYRKKDDLFECVRHMPAQFDSFKVLGAELDEFVSVARKSGNNWFVGSLTNRKARSITLDLSFLPNGKNYEATIYEDAEGSHFLKNKESYRVRKELVDSESELNIHLAPGGGNAIYFKDVTIAK
ncbi:glycoside hydrolase family 97 protein [Fulvivirga sediminis]|uniref:Glycoside hydrolase family 97 catalytic domain-containing protein n=1 Tax=Fulvivirga sediminis TaxID=2803949 RepID=A0A937F950_9BACT|nr:glycoside hydrolase family 97 protein [Fulvivirga sediminis]MBL3658757.1 glycoside hydrolase family 97 catalytic domain-containing protein [Fulvivirga sediminis]